MTIDALAIASSRYTARTIGKEIQILDYNGHETPNVVLRLNDCEAMRISALLTQQYGINQADKRRLKIARTGAGTIAGCGGCPRERGTICTTFRSPAQAWDKPGGCPCRGSVEDS